MTNFLITGGAGNIGSALASRLAETEDNQITIIDNLSTGHRSKIPQADNVTFINANVNDYNDILPVFGRFDFDYVFHFAAVVGVQRTLEHPVAVLEDIEGIKNVLSISKNSGVKRVFYSSSSEVYGEPFEIPQNENTTPLNSRLPYAIVKNVGEAFFRSYEKEYGMPYTIFRFFNTYGPHQSQDFVVPKFLKAALAGEPLQIHGDGMQTRSFCYIDDTIDTCIKTLEQDYKNTVLNVGNDKEMTVLELANKIIHITGSRSEIEHLPALIEGDMRRRCPDVTKMKTILQRELTSLDEGMQKMIHYYESNDF
ncbi:NAD-dependent epimerase/dehydratase family protein [Subsaximicrobium wynnwilliamsii]|uniref:NAD-dependent epimerase/dehydratase family protein n=1 Tax=Subsaximicrobium wynnwilliamsii TaxID=291179 RepID=A0A5C6ZCE2_9FLAO|nr:NAD-dependent epimerase/dehydratase family protein [Subsaximicrobium wynnwilliamsii]TXD81704.1 NAD-dependent epimerase/dehydratase family protein [Subsaximicrobium wynnwilliamsii]TXD87459.1 NAD-dependent epimerase/dehydratase family protein [Subsaximicrobium wynnwilliamsii]TXE01147.1 NAD-dependent epimerase/dehydratase family protein [Subsaximicrobium wynnwilliamsii]